MKVYIVSHREYTFPNDDGFLPIKVGKRVEKIGNHYVEDCSNNLNFV